MGALLTSILGGLVRLALAPVFAWLIQEGIATSDQTVELIGGITGGLVLVAWVVWNKYKDRIKFLTGLAKPSGSTEEDVDYAIQQKATPPINTPTDEPPKATPPKIAALFLAITIGAGALLGCGGPKPIDLPASLPAAAATADTAIRDAAAHALGILESVGLTLEKALTVTEAAMTAAPQVSATAKANVRQGFNHAATRGREAVVKVRAGVRSWTELKEAVDPVLVEVQTLVSLASGLGLPEQKTVGDWIGQVLSLTIFALDIIARAQGGR